MNALDERDYQERHQACARYDTCGRAGAKIRRRRREEGQKMPVARARVPPSSPGATIRTSGMRERFQTSNAQIRASRRQTFGAATDAKYFSASAARPRRARSSPTKRGGKNFVGQSDANASSPFFFFVAARNPAGEPVSTEYFVANWHTARTRARVAPSRADARRNSATPSDRRKGLQAAGPYRSRGPGGVCPRRRHST